MKFLNVATNEVVNISGIKMQGELIVSGEAGGRPEGKRFCAKWSHIITEQHDETGSQYFTVNEGWQIVRGKGGRKERSSEPTPEPTSTPESVPEAETIPEPEAIPEASVEEAEPEVVDENEASGEPAPAPASQPAPAVETGGLNDALTTAFAPIFANVARDIEQRVRANVQAEIDALKAQAKTHVTRLEITTPEGRHEVEGLFCDEFEDIVRDVKNGWSPYLWGAAGCGKSHTCLQVAEALGLDYYTQNMLNFAHEIEGYGNAAGEFVATPFFHAFSEGGLFHVDEIDRSQIEGLVKLNQALEQGIFNFPVIGNVKRHPNFRFICSGNTRMNGADEMYTSGQQQDASFKRRVVFYEMHYDRRIELPIMAAGDEVLVNFVEDVRRAIKRTGTLHFVSYTETRYMKEHEDKKEKALVRSTFKSLDIDIIRQIYGEIEDKENVWAVAMKNVIKNG